jgi:hypothetical protein
VVIMQFDVWCQKCVTARSSADVVVMLVVS